MQDTVTAVPATFTGQEPASTPDRTITYPLKGGGSITVGCPTWCTTDHADDVAKGIHPTDLLHQGKQIGLDYAPDGVEVSILQARIVQWPFSDDMDSVPHIEFTPEASTAASVYVNNRLDLDDEIRKVRAHLNALIKLGEELSEAQAATHKALYPNDMPWASLGKTDLQTMPIGYLLEAFGVTVIDTEDTGRAAVLALYGEPGAMEMHVLPDLSHQLREDQARLALLTWWADKHSFRNV